MLLVIDIGNTETVLGIYKHETLEAHWRLSSKTPRTADECWILIKSWFESDGFSITGIEGVVISSVVPSLTTVFSTISEQFLNIEPLIVSSELDTGLSILYDSPRLVGADRICNAVGGLRLHGSPLIVVDFGTATTFDIVTSNREYLGGVIALGLTGASHELHRLSAKLPRVELKFPNRVVGRTTEESIQSGIMWGTVALVDGMIDRIQEEMEWSDVKVIATGGMASVLVNRSERIQIVETYLTLDGMRFIYERVNP